MCLKYVAKKVLWHSVNMSIILVKRLRAFYTIRPLGRLLNVFELYIVCRKDISGTSSHHVWYVKWTFVREERQRRLDIHATSNCCLGSSLDKAISLTLFMPFPMMPARRRARFSMLSLFKSANRAQVLVRPPSSSVSRACFSTIWLDPRRRGGGVACRAASSRLYKPRLH